MLQITHISLKKTKQRPQVSDTWCHLAALLITVSHWHNREFP